MAENWHAQLPAQFILWKSVPQMPPQKPRKVPCDVRGNPIDPHNPVDGYYDYQTVLHAAAETQLNVGFVLTDDDPYFLFDLDDVRDAQTGAYSDDAINVASIFPGAAMEVSVSGTGMHIIGQINDKTPFSVLKNKWNNNRFEFYYRKRFIALGSNPQGNADLTWDIQLLNLVPKRDETDGQIVDYDGAVPEYNGPVDDTQLISKFLNAAGSGAQAFGDKPNMRQLWEADIAALARAYPHQTDTFDRSSADMALMNGLAFWTGKDSERMDRLFRMSALCRDKYLKREDYRKLTIRDAIAKCTQVYTSGDKTEEQKIISAQQAGFFLTDQDQQTHFENCTYVAQYNAVLTPHGLMKPDVFKAWYGGYLFKLNPDNTKPTRNAFEAFTQSSVVQFPKANRMTFDTSQPFGFITTDVRGDTAVNTYRPNQVYKAPGDVSPFLDFLSRLLPNESDRQILLSYMASVVQYPGRKFLWAPVIVGTQGNGKSTLINILDYAIDGVIRDKNDDMREYTVALKSADIDAKFNSPLLNKLFVGVHEMHSEGGWKQQREREDHLKQLITEATILIELKNIDKFNARNVANFMFCSNHRDPVRLEDNERRFSIFYTAQSDVSHLVRDGMTGDYFPNLWGWLRDTGFAAIAQYLTMYEIPMALDPTKGAQRAPRTTSHAEAVEESRPFAERAIMEAMERADTGFKEGLVSTIAVKKLFELENEKPLSGRALSNVMKAIGFNRSIRATTNIMNEGGRPRIWFDDARYGDLTDHELTQRFQHINGYDKPGLNLVS